MTTEATLREAILKTLRLDYPPSKRQVLVFGRPASAATGPGHPDLFGVALGRFFALEIKMPKARPSALQLARLYDLRQAGAYAWIVRSPYDATRAVYQAKIGGPVPTPNDPIDFDDWFKDIVSSESSTQPATHPIETAAAEAGIDVAPAEAEERDPPNGVHPPASDGFPPTLEDDPPFRLPSLDEPDTPPEEVAESPYRPILDPEPTSIQAAADADQNLAYVVEVTKAVGDRVTLVYEQGDQHTGLLRAMYVALESLTKEVIAVRKTLNSLLQEVNADDGLVADSSLQELPSADDVMAPPAPPAPRRRRKQAQPS